MAKFGDRVEKLAVCQELHQNGDPHLHAYLKLKDKIKTKDCHLFDLPSAPGGGNHKPAANGERVDGWHVNASGTRSTKNWLRYVTKKEDYIANFDAIQESEARNNHRKIGEAIIAGKPLQDLVKEMPELMMKYK